MPKSRRMQSAHQDQEHVMSPRYNEMKKCMANIWDFLSTKLVVFEANNHIYTVHGHSSTLRCSRRKDGSIRHIEYDFMSPTCLLAFIRVTGINKWSKLYIVMTPAPYVDFHCTAEVDSLDQAITLFLKSWKAGYLWHSVVRSVPLDPYAEEYIPLPASF